MSKMHPIRHLTIRKTSPKDIDTWVQLRHALWPHYSQRYLRKELQQLRARGKYESLLAIIDKEPVGFVEFQKRLHAQGTIESPVLYIEGLYVCKKYRRLGIAQRLVDQVKKIAKAEGIKILASDAMLENKISQRAHKGFGFKETHRLVHFLMKL